MSGMGRTEWVIVAAGGGKILPGAVASLVDMETEKPGAGCRQTANICHDQDAGLFLIEFDFPGQIWCVLAAFYEGDCIAAFHKITSPSAYVGRFERVRKQKGSYLHR